MQRGLSHVLDVLVQISESGLIIIDFTVPEFSGTPLMPRKVLETYPPFFPGEFSDRHRFRARKADQGTFQA